MIKGWRNDPRWVEYRERRLKEWEVRCFQRKLDEAHMAEAIRSTERYIKSMQKALT